MEDFPATCGARGQDEGVLSTRPFSNFFSRLPADVGERLQSKHGSVATTLTPELKQPVEKTSDEPVQVEIPETHTAYLTIRDGVFRRMDGPTASDHADRSLYEPKGTRS